MEVGSVVGAVIVGALAVGAGAVGVGAVGAGEASLHSHVASLGQEGRHCEYHWLLRKH